MPTDTRNSTLAISKFRSPDDRIFQPRLWMVSAAVNLVLAVPPGTAARSMATVERVQTIVEQDVSLARVTEVHLGMYSLPLPM